MRLITLFLLLVAALPAMGQGTDAPKFTGDWPNGRFWAGFSENEKLAFVLGFNEGAAYVVSGTKPNPECSKWVSDNAAVTWPDKLSFGEVVKAVDRFYQETPENMPMPIFGAITYVALKSSGATQSRLDEFAASLRKVSAQ